MKITLGTVLSNAIVVAFHVALGAYFGFVIGLLIAIATGLLITGGMWVARQEEAS